MRTIFSSVILIFCLVLMVQQTSAQKFTKKKRYWSIGGSLNAMNYAGDMDPGNFFINPALAYTRWNIGACVMYRYTSRMSFRGAFAYGRIEGDDRKTQKPDISFKEASGWRYIRGTNFTNDIFELKADVVFDMFENRGRYNKRVDWTPYGFVGLAYFFMTPKSDYGKGSKLLSEVYPTGTFSQHQIAVPLGLGVRFKIAKLFDLSVELGLRKTFTGYLDGQKGAYLDPRTLSSDQQLYDNPAMVGYGTNADVTRVINQQGIVIYDNTGVRISKPGIDSDQNQLIGIDYSGFQGGPYITPRGFGWEGNKKAEYQSDWYMVFGVQLTYIIQERVQCPKFRD